jgi:hypothetical protein
MIKNLEESKNIKKLAWTLQEISESTGLSLAFYRKEVKAKRLKIINLGRRIVVLDEDLVDYLKSGSVGDKQSK